MQFSTGRSELNPYIAVVLGLLSLAVYVAASTTTLPKLIEETQTMVRQEVRRDVPTSIMGSTAESSRISSEESGIGLSSAPATSSRSFQSTPTEPTIPTQPTFTRPFSAQTSESIQPPSFRNTPPITSVGPTVSRQFGGSEFELQNPEGANAEFSSKVTAEEPEAKSPFSCSDPVVKKVAANPATTAAFTGAGLSMATASTDTIGSSIVWTLISILIGVVVFFGLLALLARLGGVDISAAIQRGLSNDRSLYDVTISQDSVKPEPAPHIPSEPVEAKEVFQVGNGNLTYI